MPTYTAAREMTIAAEADHCFEVLTDYEHLPEWQSRVIECRVLERDELGRGSVVEYVIDVRVRRIHYRLRQLYRERRWVGSEYLGGDLHDVGGEWSFQPAGP